MSIEERKLKLIRSITEMDEETVALMEKIFDSDISVYDLKRMIESYQKRCWCCYEEGRNTGCDNC